MTSPFFGPRSRRRHPRLEVLDIVQGRLVPTDTPIVIRDLSVGGFSAESSVAFPPRTRHHFRFTTRGGSVVLLEASAVHCRLVAASELGMSYITGFEFVGRERADEAIAVLLDAVTVESSE
jgi:hypothetical protein